MTTPTHPIRHNRPIEDELHPFVYRALAALTVWLVLSVWVFFDRGAGGYVALALAVVTLFFLIFTAIPATLWLIWRRNTEADERQEIDEPFHDWISHSFGTWTGSVSGKEAAMQILLPIAAVAFGMTIFGLVLLFAVPSHGSY